MGKNVIDYVKDLTSPKNKPKLLAAVAIKLIIGPEIMAAVGLGGKLSFTTTFAIELAIEGGVPGINLFIAVAGSIGLEAGIGESAIGVSLFLCVKGGLNQGLMQGKKIGPAQGSNLFFKILFDAQLNCKLTSKMEVVAGMGLCAAGEIGVYGGTTNFAGAEMCAGLCFGEALFVGVGAECGFQLQLTASPSWKPAPEDRTLYIHVYNTAPFDQTFWIFDEQDDCERESRRMVVKAKNSGIF